MSSLSHEFASPSDFSHHVNQTALPLKKHSLGHRDEIDAADLATAAQFVARVAQSLLRRLGHTVPEPADDDAQVIPEGVLMRLEERECGNLEDIVEDLTTLNGSFSSGCDLIPAEIEWLDAIGKVADASASATFRDLLQR